MNKPLLWALLSWLSLLSFGAQAQNLSVAETFEGLSTDLGYTNNVITTYELGPSVEYFERKKFNADGSYPGTTIPLNNTQGAYTWAGENVRSTGQSNFRPAGVVITNPIANSQNFKSFVITVAMAAPRGGVENTGSGANNVGPTDRIRIQYSFGYGPWVTVKLLMGNNRAGAGVGNFEDITPLSDSVSVGNNNQPANAGTKLDRTYRDIQAALPATAVGTNLRVRIATDTRGPESAFDNIRITGVADVSTKPTLTNIESTNATYTEGSATPTQLTNTAVVGYSDQSATTLTRATVSIGNFVSGQDVLNFTNQSSITGSYNTDTGVLTLNGTASQAAYQAALRSITYSNSNTSTATGGTRQITFQVANGSTLSASVTRNLVVTAVLTAGTLNYTENFDTDGEGTRYFGNPFVETSTLVGFFRATTSPAKSGNTTIGAATFTGWSGGYWYGEGTDNGANPNQPVGIVQLPSLNATGRTNLKFTLAVGAAGNWRAYFDANNPGDHFELFYRINGGALVKFAAFSGTGTNSGPPRLDADLNRQTLATGTQLGTTLQDFPFTLPAETAGVSNLEFFLQQQATGGAELAFDNIRITGMVQTTVNSIVRASANPTNAATVNYTVTFGAPVTGLTASNFTLPTTGSVSGASVGTPVAGAGNTWTVPVNTGTGTGTLTLNLANDTNLSVDITNTLPFAGETYTIDKTAPTTTISSTGNTNNGTTNTTPIPFTVTFLENVTGFVQGDLSVTNGSISGFTAVNETTYTFSVTPTTAGTVTTVNVAAGVAQDAAGNGNTAAGQFSITYQQPLVATAQAVTVNLNANGNGTLNASSVNNGSSGSGTLTYTIQKIVYGRVGETPSPALTLTTPNGANFTAIRFASYGTPNDNGNGNYTLGSCNAANSLAAAQNAYVGRSSGTMYASNTDTRNNPVLEDPCGGTPKYLAVQAAYSADAASLTYNCDEAGKTQYVLLTVSNGTSTSTSVAQVTVNPSPTATISSVSPTSALRGATVTVTGTNLSGVSSVTVNGATAAVSGLSANGFTFVVPTGATTGAGTLTVAAPCAQTLTSTFNVTVPALTATVSTSSVSPTSNSSIPFSVTFSQSVGTTFTAADVTVGGVGGTITGFSGSGAGPYTFTVTPSGNGTISVSLAAGVAQDANNTSNLASNTVSVQFVAPTLTIGPSALPNGIQGTAYAQNLSASGGTAPYAYAITAGALPAGLSLSSGGTLSGTPTANGTFNFTVTATDASAAPGPYNGSRTYSLVINPQPVTAAPVVTTPANGSLTNNAQPTYAGTAPANSTVTVYVGPSAGTASAIGTTMASAGGTFSLTQPVALASGVYQVYATAQTSGSTVSAKSNTNTFTVDVTAPTVTLTSTVASGGTTSTSPVSFTASFTEPVTNFTSTDIVVSNGTVSSGPTAGSNNTYTFQVTPTGAGTVSVQVPTGGAQDQAGNNNTASNLYTFTFAVPTIVVSPASLPNGTQSTAYSQVFSASGGSGTYTYAITNGALPSGLSLSSSGTLSGTPTANGTFTFTVTATDNSAAPGPYSGARSYSLTIAAPAITATTWTGTISTDWFTAGNWTQGVPNATIDATIPTAPSGGRFPNISAGTAQARNFTLNSGATLTQSDGTLVIAANLTNNGTFQPTGGTVLLGNTTFSNIFGAGNIRFWNLTAGPSGVQLSTSIGASVQRLLLLNGNFSTNGNSFTLESNANLTAQVTNNNGVVNGNVTVQRYISPALNPGLGYRHYSAPVSNATVGSLATASFTPVVNAAYNTSSQPGTVTPFPTVYGYDQSRLSTTTNNLDVFDKGWFSPAALSNPLTVGQGYTVNLAANQTLSLTGPLNNGIVSQNLTRNSDATQSDAGWQLLGNPYPSPLDYAQVVAADRLGLDAAIYVYESSSQYGGSYRASVNGVGGNANSPNSLLAQGQGFFVRVSTGQTSGTLTLRNSYRLSNFTSATYQRTAETRPLVQLDLQSATGTDPLFVYFQGNATAGLDSELDAVKLPNTTGLNVSAEAGAQRLAINALPALGTTQVVVPLAVGVPAAGSFSFQAAQLLNLATTPVYLRDKQTGATVDLAQQPSYQFTVSNASALITGRFELVFSPQQPLATATAALSQQVALYPNPAKKAAFVELPASLGRQAVTASLVDALGRVVRTVTLPAKGSVAHALDLSELATGVYALRLSTSAGVVVKKLVIE
jgi:hypothetical protein